MKSRQGEKYFILVYLCGRRNKVSKKHGWKLSRKNILIIGKLHVPSQVAPVTASLYAHDIIMDKAL